MKDYLLQLKFYKEHAHMHFSKIVNEKEWGNEKLAENYLKKYWLTELEYLAIWKPRQDKIFIDGTSMPDLIYRPEFEVMVENGGSLFAKDDFNKLQKVMQEVKEEHFVVIQNSQAFTQVEPMFRMKFPVNISWEELISGNYISAVLLEMSLNEYCVFGASDNWGKYSANDYDRPLDIIGFKPALAPVFREYFRQTKEEKEEIRAWLPQQYKKLIK